jgi:NhaP-type Na+/H+ and K+/H+ antiporter
VSINVAVLLAGVLLLLGIASSKFSARLGVPVLVLFLSVGMGAGSEGLGRIRFENYDLAFSMGSVALALSTLEVAAHVSAHGSGRGLGAPVAAAAEALGGQHRGLHRCCRGVFSATHQGP